MRKIILAGVLLLFSGINLFGQDEAVFKAFVSEEYNIKINYPANWYYKEEHNEKLNAFYFTKEPIVKETDIYKTGFCIMRIKDADKNYRGVVKGQPDTTRRMFAEMTRQIFIKKNQLIYDKYETTKVAGKDAILCEFSFLNDFGEKETEFELVMFEDNTLLSLIMEAPVNEFDNYRGLYRKIISEAVLF